MAALNLVQAGQRQNEHDEEGRVQANLGIIDGVRKFVLSVRELSVDLIDSINPFGEACSVWGRSINEDLLRQMQEKIAARKVIIPFEEAEDLARRAVTFKRDRNRLPSITAQDPWKRRMAEGVAAYARYRAGQKVAEDVAQ